MKGVIVLPDIKYLKFETIERILASGKRDYNYDLSKAIMVALKDSAHYDVKMDTLEKWKNSDTD